MNGGQKILLVVAPYFPPEGGGLERYAYEITSRLAQTENWRVVIITTSSDKKRSVTEEGGMTVYRLPYQLKLSNTPLSLRWFSAIKAIAKQVKPDVLNVHLPVPGIGDVAALVVRNTKLVVTYHAGSMRKEKLPADALVWMYEHIFLPLLLRKADHIICSSDFVRLQFLHRYAYKSTTITPGVSVNAFMRTHQHITPAPTVLFVSAALDATGVHKGLSTLLAAMRKVQEAVSAAQLVVVGDGALRAGYEAYAKKYLADGSVQFAGKLFGAELAHAYQAADVFALPTENDSYPITILEAMAAELPVVSTTVGNIPLMVEEGKTGFLILPKDAGSLAKRVIDLLLDPALRVSMGKAAQEKSRAFSWEERALRYSQILAHEPSLVVQVSAYYPPHLGGIERMVEAMSARLAQEGRKVLVLTSRTNNTGATARSGNLTVQFLPAAVVAHTPFAPSLLLHLLALPRRSIVHLHLAQAYWPELVLFASKLRKTRYLVHFHLDVGPSGALGPLFVLYKKLLWGPVLRNAQTVLACSPYHRDILVGKYGVQPSAIHIIDNAVDESFFSKEAHSHPKEVLQILSVGRLVPQKRVEYMIEAMTHLKVPAHLTVVGDGEERSALEFLAHAKKLTNITFAGEKNSAEIKAYHASSDLFIISSEQEGAPLALLEAMAGSLPVLGTNVAGIRELVSGTGALVQEPYPISFARAIEALGRNKKKLQEMSEASCAKAANYSFAVFMEKIHQVYRAFPV